jgi:hypothetical protein
MFAKQIDRQRQQAIRYLMPDTCQLIPAKGSGTTITGAGIVHQTPATPRLWQGKPDIPCRADLSRAFRPAKLKAQVTEVDEFNLELPFDVAVDADDRVFIRGREFVILKVKDASNWDVTVECVIDAISVKLDNS